jgi:hypothetical protein
MHLKLRYDGPVSNFAFKFNMRRYTTAYREVELAGADPYALVGRSVRIFWPADDVFYRGVVRDFDPAAGAYTRPLFGST